MDKIAVIIPCFNESPTIEKVVSDWRRALPDAVVYVYDNNSTDGSAQLAAAAGAVVRMEQRQGKGNVIRQMFREIDAECYLITDGDDTYPAEAGPAMAREVLENGADMVVGDRLSSTYFTENKRPFHSFGNRLTRFCVNRMFKSRIRDVMTGMRAFSFQFVKTFPVLSEGFEIETEMTIHAVDKNMLVCNQVIDYKSRPAGSVSKLHTVSDGLRVIRTVLSLYKNYRPLAFFSWISLALLLLSAGFFVPLLIEYLKTGLVPRFPTLIICGFVALAALVSFFAGVILESLVKLNRQEFEFRLQLTKKIYRELKEA